MRSEGRLPLLAPDAARDAAKEAGVPAYMSELNVFRILLRNAPVARGINDAAFRLLGKGLLDPRLRELIIMRIAWRTGSVYEWAQHHRIAMGLGVPESDLVAVRDWRDSEGFDAADRAVLAATDQTIDTGTIGDETWAACRAHVGDDAEVIEVVAVIGMWRLFSSVLRSLEVPLDDGLEPWPPDGVAPSE